MWSCDGKYVRRERDAVITYGYGWKEELKEANRGKGDPYKYAESPILHAAAMRTILACPAATFGHDSGHAGRT